MSNQKVILELLERVRRRRQVGRALRDARILFAMGVIGLLLWRVIHLSAGCAPVVAAAILAALLLWVGSLAMLVRRRLARPCTLSEAAALADARAGLNDELATARWLFENRRSSPWNDAQIARAARTARQLDAAVLLPWRVDRRELSGALAVALLVIATCVLSPASRVSDAAGASRQLPRTQAESVRVLRSLLQESPDQATATRVEGALVMLEGQTATAEEKLRALSEAGQAVEQRELEGMAMRESLHRLAANLHGNQRFQELARALERGDAAAAAQIAQESAAPGGSTSERKLHGARGEEQQLARLLANLADQDQPRDGRPSAAAGETADRLDRIARQLAARDHWSQAGRALEQLRRAVADEGGSSSSLSGTRATRDGARVSDDVETAAARASAKQADSNRPDSGSSAREGGTASAAAENGRSSALLGAKAAPLAAQLRPEIVTTEGRDMTATAPKRWFFAETKRQQSGIDFEEVSARSQLALDQSAAHAGIAIRHRYIVKEYFMASHQSGYP